MSLREHVGPLRTENGAARETRTAADPTLFDPPPQAGAGEGERRKLDAQDDLRDRYPERVLAAQRAMIRLLLADPGRTVTVDDVRRALALNGDAPTHWLGAVPGELRRAGIVQRVGYVESTRSLAHARPVSVWELADADAARVWLEEHPEPAAE